MIKKRLLSLFALLCACWMLLSGCSGVIGSLQKFASDHLPDAPLAELPYLDPNIQTSFTPEILDFYYQQLTDPEEQQIYRAYLQFLIDGEKKSVYIKGSYTREQVFRAMSALQYDYPQFLTRCSRYNCTYYSANDGTVLAVEIAPIDEDYDFAAAQEAVYGALSEILTQVSGISDPRERQLTLYDLLIDRVTYDQATAQAGQQIQAEGSSLWKNMPHTAYGALIDRLAVCDGYAYTYQLLCSYAGIPCATVIGMSQQDAAPTGEYQENHAWNMVQIGEDYYYCDPTWDDNGDQYLDASGEWVTAQTPQEGMTAILPAVLHRYYNLPYEQMILAHRFSPMFQYPQRTGPACDYYTQTGRIASSRGELERFLSAACMQLGDQPVGIELRINYPASDYTQEIFSRMRVIGAQATAMVSYTFTGSCFIVLVRA